MSFNSFTKCVKIIYRPISFNSSGQLYKAKLLLATFDIPYIMLTPTFDASNSSSFTQSFSRNLESETNHDLEFEDSQFSQRLQRSQTRPRQKTGIERVESSQNHIQESQHHNQSTPTQELIPSRPSPPSPPSPPPLTQAKQIDERTVDQIIEELENLNDEDDIELDSTENDYYFFRQVNPNNDKNEFILASGTDTDGEEEEEEEES